MTIIGEILSFRAMAQQGLREVGAPHPVGPLPCGTPTHRPHGEPCEHPPSLLRSSPTTAPS